MEPVRQLDDQDPPVSGHRDKHLAHRGGLLCLFRVETEPVQLRDAVHDRRDRRTELLLDLGKGHPGVLHRVVQQRRCSTYRVQAKLGHDSGDRDRVGDVRLAGEPVLILVSHRRVGVCPPHQVEVLVAASCAERREDAFDLRGRRRDDGAGGILGRYLGRLASRPGQHGIDHGHNSNLAAEGDRTSEFASSRRSPRPAAQLGLLVTPVTNPILQKTPAEKATP